MSSCVLISREGDQVELCPELAEMSKFINVMLGDPDGDFDDTLEDIPLPDVKTSFIQHATEFCKHYKIEPMGVIEKPLRNSNMQEHVQEWYANFIDTLDMTTLQELSIAANYLDIQPLLELCCAKLAALIKGKSAEQIRETFGIVKKEQEEETKS